MNRYLTALLLAFAATAHSQSLQPAPRLVVNITIDQLRTDYIEAFSPYYGTDGFKKILTKGRVYEAASYAFTPLDRASAIASIHTGTTPYYNNIVGSQWLDRTTLRPVYCVDDSQYGSSPSHMSTSTLGDELKVATNGFALVFAFGVERDAAILSAGHAADAAIWIDKGTGLLTSSPYYSEKAHKWLNAYNKLHGKRADDDDIASRNLAVSQAAQACVTEQAMGRDNTPDLLTLTLSAEGKHTANWLIDMESVYIKLDGLLADLISKIEAKVGADNVLFMITSTGYTDEDIVDYSRYRIPTGTFYINRTANLLNMYLGALYEPGKYVETCFHNEIFLNHKLLEQKRIGLHEVQDRCQEFLLQISGIRDVYTTNRLLNGTSDTQKLRNGHHPSISGDIIVDVAPGWQLFNEDNLERYTSRASFVPFPIIFYGTSAKDAHINTPVVVDRIAPTVAKAIRIRAPNACKAEPLF